MAQNYDPTLPASGVTTFGELYQILRDKDEALRSNFSGTDFPSNPIPGQRCAILDADGKVQKVYLYTGNSSLGTNGWVEDVIESAGIGAEVVNARGTKPTLDQRLDVSLNEDGTLKSNVAAYQSEWIKPSLTFTYVAPNQFSVNGDQTDIYYKGRRLKCNLEANVVYSSVSSSSYSSGTDTTTVTLEDNVLDSTLVDVEHSIIHSNPRISSFPFVYINHLSGFKNRIINGDFAIWQRGTSASYSSDADALTQEFGYKSADRFACANSRTGGQFTVSKSTMNGHNSFKITVDTPPADLSWDGTNRRWWEPFRYFFEGQHLYDLVNKNATITISFLFRSNVSGTFSVALQNNSYTGQTGGDDVSQQDIYVTTFSYPGDESVQNISITIPLNHSWVYGVFNDEKQGFGLWIATIGDCAATSTLNQWVSGLSGQDPTLRATCAAGCTNWAAQAGNYIEIAQLQLEEGEVATEFEYVPYEIQLIRCMRYFYSTTYPHRNVGNLVNAFTSVATSSTDFYEAYYELPVTMRTVPSITIYAYESGTVGAYRDKTAGTDASPASIGSETSRDRVYFWCSGSSLTANHKYSCHFTADAEL